MGADAGRGRQADRYWHTLLAVAADNPHSVNDPRSVPPLHACCRCVADPVVNVPGVDTSREALAPEGDEV